MVTEKNPFPFFDQRMPKAFKMLLIQQLFMHVFSNSSQKFAAQLKREIGHVGVAGRYGARLLRGRARVRASLTPTYFIFALISSVPSPIGLYHVVLALHITMGKMKTDI